MFGTLLSNIKSVLFFFVPKSLLKLIKGFRKQLKEERARKEQIKEKMLNFLQHKRGFVSCPDIIGGLRRLDGTIASENDIWWAVQQLRNSGIPVLLTEQWGVELISGAEPPSNSSKRS